MKAKVSLRADKPGPEINPFLFGHFIENMGKSIYRGGLLATDGSVRPEVESALADMGCSMIRWPGGLFADGYHWRDGIGSVRPVRPNRYWRRFTTIMGPKDPNHFGTHEFLALCERLKSEPYINVNLGTGTPESAAEWVQYCNDANHEEREGNGRPDPWNVKVWGIGNEIFGWWALGHSGPEAYGRKYLRFLDAMNEADPSIEPVAVGIADEMPDWNPKLLDVIGDKAAYLAYHLYLPAVNKPQYFFMRLGDTARNHYSLAAAYLELDRKLKYVAAQIETALGPEVKMKIALDEWNLWWWWTQCYAATWRMRDAVSVAGMAGAMIDNCDNVKIGNIAQAINVLGLIRTNNDQVVRTPLLYVMQLFNQAIKGRRISCDTQCGSFTSEKLGGIPAASAVPYVSAYSAVDGKKFGMILIQRRYEGEMTIELDTPGVNLMELRLLSGSTPGAFNDFHCPDVVNVQTSPINNGKGGAAVTLPAGSVAAVTGELAK